MLDKKFSHERGRAKPADGDEEDEGDEGNCASVHAMPMRMRSKLR